MNTVIFARGKDIEGQIAHCREYAERKGYTVTGVIVGLGQELPGIIKALESDIDLILVKCMSRISRNALEGYTIQTELEIDCGVVVEVATDTPRDEAADRFMKNVIMAVWENEERLRERVRREFEFREYMERGK